jgi:hypothetical protein
MKRPWLILLGGLALALAAYAGAYFSSSAKMRCMTTSAAPELAWLQTEFKLSDAEMDRVQKLHDSYLSACMERCQRIDAKNAELRTLLAATNVLTPEIEKAISEAAQLRADCQRAMLEHFFRVSQTMPPEQGKRYFGWVVSKTFGSEHAAMVSDPVPASEMHEHPHE